MDYKGGYLFSFLNLKHFKDPLLFLDETHSFYANLLWGKLSNITSNEQYGYLLECHNPTAPKEKKYLYIKLNSFLDMIDESLQHCLKLFLLTIQNQFKLEIIFNDQQKPMFFRMYTSLHCDDIGNSSRQSIESERTLTFLVHMCFDSIFIESFKPPCKHNENLKDRGYTCDLHTSNCLPLHPFKTNYIDLETRELTCEQRQLKCKRKGGILFHETLSDVRKCCLLTSQNPCLIIYDSDEEWSLLPQFEKVYHIKTLQDFEELNFTFSGIAFISSAFLELPETQEYLMNQEEDARFSLQKLIENNVFMSKKDDVFAHPLDLTLTLAKRIFFNQAKHFPLKTVPFLWFQFQTVFFDTSKSFHITSQWNWTFYPIEIFCKNQFVIHSQVLTDVIVQRCFDLQYYNEYQVNQLKPFFVSWLHDCSMIFPISNIYKSKILPMQLYFQLNTNEKDFLMIIDELYKVLNSSLQGLGIPSHKRFRIKDILFNNPKAEFPYRIYSCFQRSFNMSPQDAIENIRTQVWPEYEDVYDGLPLHSILMHWKFDKDVEPNLKYVSLLENLNEEQPYCYICYESAPVKIGICGHGYCHECYKTLIDQKDCKIVCPCPLCRVNLTKFDWVHVNETEEIVHVGLEEKELIPSKYIKMFEEIQKSIKTKILVIVPNYSSENFIEYLQNKNLNFDLFTRFEDLQGDKWICIQEERDLEKCRTQINMEVVYYISPEYSFFKKIYMFLLHNVLKRPFLQLIFVISNHEQEENNLLKLLDFL